MKLRVLVLLAALIGPKPIRGDTHSSDRLAARGATEVGGLRNPADDDCFVVVHGVDYAALGGAAA